MSLYRNSIDLILVQYKSWRNLLLPYQTFFDVREWSINYVYGASTFPNKRLRNVDFRVF